MLLDSFVKAPFDFQILDDRFDDQVAVFQFREIVFEVSDGDEGSEISDKKGGGLRFVRGLETRASNAIAIKFLRPS